jgi:hypothetical protein
MSFLCCLTTRGVQLTSTAIMEPGFVYLKLFKDVDVADLDMLLPGAKAKFTWLDWCMVRCLHIHMGHQTAPHNHRHLM